MSENFLSQEEIDALLRKQTEEEKSGGNGREDEKIAEDLTQEEKDALGEIGNISMGSAATALSDLLRQRVTITTPSLEVTTQKELFDRFEKPFVVIEVNYTEGLSGSNIFFMHTSDALIIADLMMGGDGKDTSGELTELHLSAVAEAMNQMMGTAATSMSNMFGFSVMISPPKTIMVDFNKEDYDSPLTEEKIVVISFKLVVGDLVNSQFMQVIPFEVAQKKARMLLDPSFLSQLNGANKEDKAQVQGEAVEQAAGETEQEPYAQVEEPVQDHETSEEIELGEVPTNIISQKEQRNLDLILDVPLKVSVVLGRTKKPIGEVLNLSPGTIVELDSLANEPVDILVNGTLIAQGEVVVVNENFGVQIKNIISPEERIHRLR